ncbi:hypothetical protein APSETT444_001649 [Aspergillus pseudonomiae]
MAGNNFAARYVVNIAMSAMTIIFSTVLRVYLGRLNKKLDQEEGADLFTYAGSSEGPEVAANRGFRFLL